MEVEGVVKEGGGGGGRRRRRRWKEVEGVDENGVRPQFFVSLGTELPLQPHPKRLFPSFLQSSRCVRLCPVSSQNSGKET